MKRNQLMEIWKAKQITARRDADDDEGRWITTENGHKVHINGGGEPDKGNPHVLKKMNGGNANKGKKSESSGYDKDKISSKSRMSGKEVTLKSLKENAKNGDKDETIQNAMDLAFDHPEYYYEVRDALSSSGLDKQFEWEMGSANTNAYNDVIKPAIDKAKNNLKSQIPSPSKNKSSSAVINGKKVTFSNVRNAMYPDNSRQQRFIDITITDPDTGEKIGSYAANDYESAMDHVYRIAGLKVK